MQDFPQELKIAIAASYHGYCAYHECWELCHSIHHKLPNTKYNQASFPLFIESPMNGVPLCEYHHREKAHEFQITIKQAELYEQWLQALQQKNV